MKILFTILILVFSVHGVASDCIIDPQKVMVHASSEPLFINSEDQQQGRGLASTSAESHLEFTRSPDQYLEVLKVIPLSEPTVQRSWLEYKVLKEN